MTHDCIRSELMFAMNSTGNAERLAEIFCEYSFERDIKPLRFRVTEDTLLHTAVRLGNPSLVKFLLDFYDGNERNKDGMTGAEIAITNNQRDIIDMFHERNLFDPNQLTTEGVHPLAIANKTIARKLIELGADPNHPSNPISEAIRRENVGGFKVMMKLGVKEIFDENGRNWLLQFFAQPEKKSSEGKWYDLGENIGEYLLRKRYNDVGYINHVDHNGDNLLTINPNKIPESIVRNLRKYPFDVDHINDAGVCPLVIAARQSHNTFGEMLEAGADPIPKFGEIMMAIFSHRHIYVETKMVEFLHGEHTAPGRSKPIPPILPFLLSRSSTAARYFSTSMSVEMLEILAKAGEDMNARGSTGATALVLAGIGGDKYLIKSLVRLGANVTTSDSFGETIMDNKDEKISKIGHSFQGRLAKRA